MRIFTRKRAAALGAILALGGGTLAYAYWTTGGSGTGSAATGTVTTVTVNQTATITGLYPGQTVALTGNFNNPNSGKVYVTSVTASVHTFSLQADTNKPPCTQGDFTITGNSNTPGDIAAGNGVGAWSGLSLNFTDAGTNQDNCKNITVPIDYTAN